MQQDERNDSPSSDARYANVGALDPAPESSWGKLLTLIPQAARVLDLGCAQGSFALTLRRRRGCHVVGVEFDSRAAAVAADRCDSVIQGDIATLLTRKMIPGRYDVILCADVLEHLPNPKLVLELCRPLLNRAGRVVASIPNSTHASIVLALAEGRFPRSKEGLLDDTHIQFWGEQDLLELFESASFQAHIVDRVIIDPRLTEFASSLSGLSDDVLAFLDRNPNAKTYQFIVEARLAERAELPGKSSPPPPGLKEGLVADLARTEQAAALMQTRLESVEQALDRSAIERDALSVRLDQISEDLREAQAQQTPLLRAVSNAEAATQDLASLLARRRALMRWNVSNPGEELFKSLRVLYVSDRVDPPYRYRCVNACQQLREAGVLANIASIHDKDLLVDIPKYSLIVLFRLPYSERVQAVIKAARVHGATVAFDIDDLIFLTNSAAQMPFWPSLGTEEREQYTRNFASLQKTLSASDLCVASTEAIARHARLSGRTAIVHPNLLSREQIVAANQIAPLRRLLSRSPVIGYFSGSNTHDPDLAVVTDSLVEVLERRPDAYLLLCGHLAVPPGLRAFHGRIRTAGYQQLDSYFLLMARCRAVIAPAAEINDFSNAKSALKVFEAGILGVPAVASPTAAFLEAIEEGVSGFIPRTETEWTQALLTVLEPRVSFGFGVAARAIALTEYSPNANYGALARRLLPFAGRMTSQSQPILHSFETGDGPRPGWLRNRLRLVNASIGLPGSSVGAQDLYAWNAQVLAPVPIEEDMLRRWIAGAKRVGSKLISDKETIGTVLTDLSRPLSQTARLFLVSESSEHEGSYLSFGDDPRIEFKENMKGAGTERYLLLEARLRADSSRTLAQLFWAPATSGGFRESKSVRIPVYADGLNHLIVVDLSQDSNGPFAKDESYRIRFDPADCPAEFELSFLAILSALPPENQDSLWTVLANRFLVGHGLTLGSVPPLSPTASASILESLEADPSTAAGEPFAFALALNAPPIVNPSLRDLVERLLTLVNAGAPVITSASGADWSASALRRLSAAAELIEFGHDPSSDATFAVFQRRVETHGVRRPVDIIIPIYNGPELVGRCVRSVLRHARGDYRLLLIDDASPDASISPLLSAFAAANPHVVLMRNSTNKGFVGTTNRGMREAGDRDVLLLNSDTEVFEGFLDRLSACAYSDTKTGIVTPLSNNATICSVPDFPKENSIPPGYTAATWAALVTASSTRSFPDLVTGVGFCMYVTREVLNTVGYFDEDTFGLGFGEENDLCERAKKAGFRIVLCDDVFVYHLGKGSFGAVGTELGIVNSKKLEAKHPGYHAAVARFIEENPLREIHERIRFHQKRLSGSAATSVLFLVHSSIFTDAMGGTEHHLRDLICSLRLPRIVIAYPSGFGVEVAEILEGDISAPQFYHFALSHLPARFSIEDAEIQDLIERLLKLFEVRLVHIHHLMHWPVLGVARSRRIGVPYIYSSHDYYAVCPSWNLYDRALDRPCACSPEQAETCIRATFAACSESLPEAPSQVHHRHRLAFEELLAGAAVVVVPSTSAESKLRLFYPGVNTGVRVIEHGQATPLETIVRGAAGERLRVAFVGEIAHPLKGASNYLSLLAMAPVTPIDWHLYGNVDQFAFRERAQAAAQQRTIHFHGSYRRDEIVARLSSDAIDVLVCLPAVDETFSYVLSEAFAAGVPAIVGSTGAVADRVRETGAGWVVESVEDAGKLLGELCVARAALDVPTAHARAYSASSPENNAQQYRMLYDAVAPEITTGRFDAAVLREVFDQQRPRISTKRGMTSPIPIPSYQRAAWYPLFRAIKPLFPSSLRRWGRQRLTGHR